MDQPLWAQPEALKSFQLVLGGTGAAHQRGKRLNEAGRKVFAANGELLKVFPSSSLQQKGSWLILG